jgi:hypothetical protein
MEPFRAAVSADKRALVCGWAGLAAIVFGAAAMWAGTLHAQRALPDGVTSPILALELIHSPTRLSDIAPTDADRQQLREAVRLDYLFIAAYAAFFVAVGAFAAAALGSAGKSIAIGIVVSALAAAAFDVLEDRGMLRLLDGVSDAAPRVASLWKWRLLFVAAALSAPVLVDRRAPPFRQVIGYVAAIAAIFAGVQGVVATAVRTASGLVGDSKLIEVAAGHLVTLLVLSVLFFLTRRTLRDGILPALDRFSTWPAVAWLVDWPTPDRDEVVGGPEGDSPR